MEPREQWRATSQALTLRTADIRPADNSPGMVCSNPEARRNRYRQTGDAQKGRASRAVRENGSRGGHTTLCPADDFDF